MKKIAALVGISAVPLILIWVLYMLMTGEIQPSPRDELYPIRVLVGIIVGSTIGTLLAFWFLWGVGVVREGLK